MPLQQTRSHDHTHSSRISPTLHQPNECVPWPLLPAFTVLHDHLGHFVDVLSSIIFVVSVLCYFLQVLHVCHHQHVPQQQEVRVKRILHWHMKRQQACMNSWTGHPKRRRQSLWQYLLLHPRDRSDPWPFVLYSRPERRSRWLQTGYCPAERRGMTTARRRGDAFKASEERGKMDLHYLVLSLKIFIFIRITLRQLVDVDPKLLDFLFDLQHTHTHQWHHWRDGGVWSLYMCGYLLLLSAHLPWRQAVSFGQHRNYVDLFAQTLHALHVQRSEAATQMGECEHWDVHLPPRPPVGSGFSVTRGWMVIKNTGNSGLCCLGGSSGSARSRLWSTAQTAGRCSPPTFPSWGSNTRSLWVLQQEQQMEERLFVSRSSPSWTPNPPPPPAPGGSQADAPFCVIDCVSEPWRVYDGEPQSDSFLLDADCVFDDVDCLFDLF